MLLDPLKFLFQDTIDPLRFLVQRAQPAESAHPKWSGGRRRRIALGGITGASAQMLPHRVGQKVLERYAPLSRGGFSLAEECIGYFYRSFQSGHIFP